MKDTLTMTDDTIQPESNPAWDAADAKNQPLLYYAYILELADGGYYAGHTKNLRVRLAEHSLGTTKATQGKKGKVVWFTQTYDRDNAARIEARLKRAIAKGDSKVQDAIADFESLVAVIKPQKTLAELQAEELTYRRQMERWMHVMSHHPPKSACGWSGKAYGYWESDNGWAQLARDARVHAAAEAAGGRAAGREPCVQCLELMPAAYRSAA